MSLRFLDNKWIEEENIFAFDAYFSTTSVEICGASYPLGSVVTEFLNYDETEYVMVIDKLEECFKKNDEENFLNYIKKANEIIKQMSMFQQNLKETIFFEPPLNKKTKFPQEDKKYVIEYNKPIMEKAITKYLNLKNDLLYIKKVYIHLLEEMEKEMQTVTASEKYEKAIQVPLLAEYLKGNSLESVTNNNSAKSYTKFLVRKSLSTGELEIFERRIFNRLLDFIYIEFCKALMQLNMPKKCKNCGMYFLLENGFKNEYCTRPLKENSKKTCRDVGAAQSFKMKVSQSPEWKIHQRAYKKYYARLKKGQMTQEEFDRWAKNAEYLRSEALAGKIDIKKFETVLNKL